MTATDETRTGAAPIGTLPPEIAEQIARERSGRGSLESLHRWWARRPAVLARLATYLALTERQERDEVFLAALGKESLPPAVLRQVAARVREAQWRWAWREARHAEDTGQPAPTDPPELGPPRVLDPFAGGGVFSVEAARLGCEAAASDLNPLAFHLLRAGLQYPSSYGAPDRAVPGSSPAGTWAGLAAELAHWARRVQGLANERVASLFPPLPDGPNDEPSVYVWFQTVRCPNPACGLAFPLQPCARVGRPGRRSRRLCLVETAGVFEARLEDGDPAERTRDRGAVCPRCATAMETSPALDQALGDGSLLGAVVVEAAPASRVVPVAPADRPRLVPWSAAHARRLDELAGRGFARLLRRQLPEPTYAHLRRRGFGDFSDLFSARQRLVALEYAEAITLARGEMWAEAIPEERATALTTYLAFFLGHVVDRNSRLCPWRGVTAGSTFDRAGAALPWVWAERNPAELLEPWLTRVRSAIDLQAGLPGAAAVQLADAARMGWPDESFDAIVTDPPYFDRVPYDDLADFYWAWEGGILGDATPPAPPPAPTTTGPADRAEEYRAGLLHAFQEGFRVLKPGRVFAMILTVDTQQRFDEYVAIAQEAGFELADVRALPEPTVPQATQPRTVTTFLISFRKPFVRHARPLIEAEAEELQGLLAAAASGRPVLYAGLAQLLLDELAPEDLAGIVPAGARGSAMEQVMEVLAYEDPRSLLERSLGMAGLRRVAKSMGLLDGQAAGVSPLDAVLAHFGLTVPAPSTTKGVEQVLQEIRRSLAQVQTATNRTQIRGPFLDASTAIERLVRMGVWGWAQAVFGADRDNALRSILTSEERPNVRLGRLPFGDVVTLFERLPDVVAGSPQAPLVEAKLGRRHPYLPNNKQTRFTDRVRKVVAQRNRIEHDSGGYWSGSPLAQLASDCAAVLSDAADLVGRMAAERAVPRVATAILEIRDQWGRVSYRLVLDDGTEAEIYLSNGVPLGKPLLYFGSATNPRPVDPLYVLLDDLGAVP